MLTAAAMTETCPAATSIFRACLWQHRALRQRATRHKRNNPAIATGAFHQSATSRPSKPERRSRTLDGRIFAERFSQGPGFNERLLDALVGHALFKEQHTLAHRALSGISVLDPSRLVPKTAPALRASDQK
ncbi:MAG: hypothetical protein J0G34_13735 [Afipia sp.]|nr:hypothetical protein [Afipia sp.]